LISWADLIILAGNVAIESMMAQEEPLWFGGGRVDAFATEEDVFWGNESEWLRDDGRGIERKGNEKDNGLNKPLGATQMGLIYVNPVSRLLKSLLVFTTLLLKHHSTRH
jgi:catalase-peroxidase